MDATTTDTVIEITEVALDRILELRETEAIPGLHLGLRISGVAANGFAYETAFLRPEDVDDTDYIEHHRDLPVAIPQDSVGDLQGAVLDLSGESGLVLRNPNMPASPGLGGPEVELSGSPEEKVQQLIDGAINPAIAAHGGYVRLVGVDLPAVHLEMGGGCQGCGLAAMTLRQGIEREILSAIPEIEEVVDSTDHTMGANPYYA